MSIRARIKGMEIHKLPYFEIRLSGRALILPHFPQVRGGGTCISHNFEKGRDRNDVFLHALRILEQGDIAMQQNIYRKIHVLTQHVIIIMA